MLITLEQICVEETCSQVYRGSRGRLGRLWIEQAKYHLKIQTRRANPPKDSKNSGNNLVIDVNLPYKIQCVGSKEAFLEELAKDDAASSDVSTRKL
mgnify:CR=1 FL=1